MAPSGAVPRQFVLFCNRCRSCYSRSGQPELVFGGFREEGLDRARRVCNTCGETRWLVAHHRRAGFNDPGLLITGCVVCQARIHRLTTIRTSVPVPLVPLWAEHHSGMPVQLQLSTVL